LNELLIFQGEKEQMLQSRQLGFLVALFGALGSDFIATKHLEILRKDGIIIDLIQFTKESSSGQAYVIVDSYGRNSIQTGKRHTG
jgi:sugar/nucleoside kinase (ribokinase family)